MPRKKILVVEDDRDIAFLLKEAIGQEGYDVITAENGNMALEYIEEFLPELIVMDVVLPHKSGIAVLNEIKQKPGTKEIPVIMISVLSEKEIAFPDPAVEFIKKPIAIDYLLGKINILMNKESAAPAKLLVIDDDRNIADLLKELFRQKGFNSFAVYGGKEGIRETRSLKPAVVILDLDMPDVDGFRVMEELEREISNDRVRILVLTSLPFERVRDKCYDLGAKAFLNKPFEEAVLMQVVNSILCM
ncbi:MAG TPA: response regulator [bacterium]|nr:response regulator [bacterium]